MRLALDLSLPSDSELLGATRKVLATCLHELGAPTAVVDDVILAMDEACSNVLRHAYPHGHDGSCLVRADVGKEQIQIEVIDDGVGFDVMATRRHPEEPEQPEEPEPEGLLAPGGRGMEVMRRLMTTVEVESPTSTGGTRLRLVRLLPPFGE